MTEADKVMFIGWIADRFQERHYTPLPRAYAMDMAACALKGFEDMEAPFGDPAYSWDQGGASDIADEEIHAGWEAAP